MWIVRNGGKPGDAASAMPTCTRFVWTSKKRAWSRSGISPGSAPFDCGWGDV